MRREVSPLGPLPCKEIKKRNLRRKRIRVRIRRRFQLFFRFPRREGNMIPYYPLGVYKDKGAEQK